MIGTLIVTVGQIVLGAFTILCIWAVGFGLYSLLDWITPERIV